MYWQEQYIKTRPLLPISGGLGSCPLNGLGSMHGSRKLHQEGPANLFWSSEVSRVQGLGPCPTLDPHMGFFYRYFILCCPGFVGKYFVSFHLDGASRESWLHYCTCMYVCYFVYLYSGVVFEQLKKI